MKAPSADKRDRIILKLLKDHAPKEIKLLKSLQELQKEYHLVHKQKTRL